jgi:hypothetical protein
MRFGSRTRLVIPSTLAVTVIGVACSSQSSTSSSATTTTTTTTSTVTECDVVLVPDAGALTYACQDGRACSTPMTDAIDAGPNGVYQVCPGPSDSDCATLVDYAGQTTLGYC